MRENPSYFTANSFYSNRCHCGSCIVVRRNSRASPSSSHLKPRLTQKEFLFFSELTPDHVCSAMQQQSFPVMDSIHSTSFFVPFIPSLPHFSFFQLPFHSSFTHWVLNSIIHSILHSFIHSLILSFIHSFIDSFIHSFIHALIHWFIHSFIQSFVHSVVRSFVHSFAGSFSHAFIRSFTHSFIHSVNHSINHSTIQSFSHAVMQSFIRAFIRLCVRSFIHAFMQPFFHSIVHSIMQSFHSFRFSFVESLILKFFQLITNSYRLSPSYSHRLFSKLPPRRMPSTTITWCIQSLVSGWKVCFSIFAMWALAPLKAGVPKDRAFIVLPRTWKSRTDMTADPFAKHLTLDKWLEHVG